eukprot:6208102-Pleurochrysis_carterae.AAC.4
MCARIHARTRTGAHARTLRHRYAHARARTRTHAHARTGPHRPSHALTRIHTHSPALIRTRPTRSSTRSFGHALLGLGASARLREHVLRVALGVRLLHPSEEHDESARDRGPQLLAHSRAQKWRGESTDHGLDL